MKLKIKFLTNKSFDLEIEENTTIQELYEMLKSKDLKNDFILVSQTNIVLNNTDKVTEHTLLLIPKDVPYNLKDVEITFKKN